MRPTITSGIIGPLTQTERFPGWWQSEEIPVPLLEGEFLRVIFQDYDPALDPAFIADADEALKNFLAKTVEDRAAASALVYQNCADLLPGIDDEIADEIRSIGNAEDIWQFVYPSDICVSRNNEQDDKDIYIRLACECLWDPEHGLQLVYRKGAELTRVSEQDGFLS